MSEVEEALSKLEAASGRVAQARFARAPASSTDRPLTSARPRPQAGARRHLLACCTAMRNAVADARAGAPATDTLALMDSLPEALVACRPPSICESTARPFTPAQ